MRPGILDPLFADVTSLRGVGPKVAAQIGRVAGSHVLDLLLTPPTGLIDRSHRVKVAELTEDRIATVRVRIDRHVPPPPGKSLVPWKTICSDETGYLTLVFFRPKPDWITRQLPEGEWRWLSGRIEQFGSERQMAHPDHMVGDDDVDALPAFETTYALTAGLSQRIYRRAVLGALPALPELDEWHEPSLVAAHDWPTFGTAIRHIHCPESPADNDSGSRYRRRLAYDELLANQLSLALVRERGRTGAGRALLGDGSLTGPARALLPYALTAAQERVLAEIGQDMASDHRMVRLVQGDVGAGKTVVALIAMLTAIEAGKQAAIMAPTEILARQHAAEFEPLCEKLNISMVLITGRDRGPERVTKRDGVRKGYVPLVVGTHALFSDDVEFADLGLVVVDEQHRFGVAQRMKLQDKAQRPDVLVMTATPIPRTLTLTLYGDMDVSRLDEKPPGRKPVTTRAIPQERLDDVLGAVGRAVDRGEQVYWVCPLVQDDDEQDMVSAEGRAATLSRDFGAQVGLVHGQMAAEARDGVMRAFAAGEVNILVATTVIEVGVNSPRATLMIIEHAERFGLAQLHQLRGRVGRGELPGACLLLYAAGQGGLSPTAKARLSIMRETDDGFRIAEEDLALRGPGDALGTSQSGFPQFRLADLQKQGELLDMARQDAEMVVRSDPALETPRGTALRTLLYLFGQDQAVRRLRSG
jgi:ATP-dependent DNA helicase RecG